MIIGVVEMVTTPSNENILHKDPLNVSLAYNQCGSSRAFVGSPSGQMLCCTGCTRSFSHLVRYILCDCYIFQKVKRNGLISRLIGKLWESIFWPPRSSFTLEVKN